MEYVKEQKNLQKNSFQFKNDFFCCMFPNFSISFNYLTQKLWNTTKKTFHQGFAKVQIWERWAEIMQILREHKLAQNPSFQVFSTVFKIGALDKNIDRKHQLKKLVNQRKKTREPGKSRVNIWYDANPTSNRTLFRPTSHLFFSKLSTLHTFAIGREKDFDILHRKSSEQSSSKNTHNFSIPHTTLWNTLSFLQFYVLTSTTDRNCVREGIKYNKILGILNEHSKLCRRKKTIPSKNRILQTFHYKHYLALPLIHFEDLVNFKIYIWAIPRQIAHFFPFISQIFFKFCWLVESRRA